jgi:hypothetical protein
MPWRAITNHSLPYCETNGWQIAAIFIDAGVSASMLNCPELERAIAAELGPVGRSSGAGRRLCSERRAAATDARSLRGLERRGSSRCAIRY